MENSLWKRLWTCLETDDAMSDDVSDRWDNFSRHPRMNGRKTLSLPFRLA